MSFLRSVTVYVSVINHHFHVVSSGSTGVSPTLMAASPPHGYDRNTLDKTIKVSLKMGTKRHSKGIFVGRWVEHVVRCVSTLRQSNMAI